MAGLYLCLSVGRLYSASHGLVCSVALILMGLSKKAHCRYCALIWAVCWPLWFMLTGLFVLKEALWVFFCILPVSVLDEGESSGKIWQCVF